MAADSKKLIKEITGLLTQIDTQGLLFLKQQAGVLIHNQATKELYETRALDTATRTKKGSAKGAAKKGSTKSAPKRPEGVTVEQNGKNFIIVTSQSRSMFGLDEIKSLVRMCETADTKTAGAAMYLWMRKERSDFLANAGVGGPTDIKMIQLAEHLKAHFTSGRK